MTGGSCCSPKKQDLMNESPPWSNSRNSSGCPSCCQTPGGFGQSSFNQTPRNLMNESRPSSLAMTPAAPTSYIENESPPWSPDANSTFIESSPCTPPRNLMNESPPRSLAMTPAAFSNYIQNESPPRSLMLPSALPNSYIQNESPPWSFAESSPCTPPRNLMNESPPRSLAWTPAAFSNYMQNESPPRSLMLPSALPDSYIQNESMSSSFAESSLCTPPRNLMNESPPWSPGANSTFQESSPYRQRNLMNESPPRSLMLSPALPDSYIANESPPSNLASPAGASSMYRNPRRRLFNTTSPQNQSALSRSQGGRAQCPCPPNPAKSMARKEFPPGTIEEGRANLTEEIESFLNKVETFETSLVENTIVNHQSFRRDMSSAS